MKSIANSKPVSPTLGEKIMKDVIVSGAAKVVVALIALTFTLAFAWWKSEERPRWMIDLVQTTAASGEMDEDADWCWDVIALKPIDGQPNQMEFSDHPDGEVLIEFTSQAMNFADNDPAEREFVVYCGTHRVKTGTGKMSFHRNFQVVRMFDLAGSPLFELWFRGDLTSPDANGKVARHASQVAQRRDCAEVR